jgi:hypothetical protein
VEGESPGCGLQQAAAAAPVTVSSGSDGPPLRRALPSPTPERRC